MADLKQQNVSIHCRVIPRVAWLDSRLCPFTDALAVFRYAIHRSPAAGLTESYLTLEEIARANRYYQEADRNRFVYTRILLKLVLGKYLRSAPYKVLFANGVNNKPELKELPNWRFNVSHAGDWVLLAIGRQEVGVDVEAIRPDFDLEPMLEHSFSTPEQNYIGASADPRATFYQLWTCKEALVKATAKGIDDDFRLIPSLPGTHQVEGHLVGTEQNWITASFQLEADYAAAITYPFGPVQPLFYTIDDRVLQTQNP